MKKHSLLINTGLFLFILTLTAAHAETALVIKTDSLREKPFTDAKVLAALTAKQQVDIVARNGAWYQVAVTGKKGWVHMLSVRKTTAAATASAGSLSSVASGRSSTGTIIATTGIRGLNEENLTQATYNEAAIAKAETYRVNNNAVVKFAADGKLKTRQVPTLLSPNKRGK